MTIGPSLYFDWLQAGTPAGEVARFPELTNRFETLPNRICRIGDLTGVPLMNLAASSGAQLIE